MISHPILPLVALIVVTSAAVVCVALLRVPLRRVAGAQAAYWIWLFLPASALAVLLPSPSASVGIGIAAVPAPLRHALAISVVDLTFARPMALHVLVWLLIWAGGASAMFALAVRRQRAFVRSLGHLSPMANGTYETALPVEPMLVGAFQPRVVLPTNFETHYTADERALVLAHERAHVQRGDALANAIAVGWLCLSWFNPLMYWAFTRFRLDQELACDAAVLTTTGHARRQYADALLKTRLLADSIESVPIGCHWQSSHPLRERIATLKRPLPGMMRRTLGVGLALALTASASYAAWTTQPEPQLARILAAAGRTIDVDCPSSVPPLLAGSRRTHRTNALAGTHVGSA